MGADNWAVCPRCRARAEARIAALRSEAQAAYGTAPIEEFDRLRAESEKPVDLGALTTFREDYEICGAEEGEMCVSYGGGCGTCGLTHKFSHTERFWTPGDLGS